MNECEHEWHYGGWGEALCRLCNERRQGAEVKVVKVPTVPIHPRLIERYERERAELTKLIKPEVMEKADQEVECFVLGTGRKRGQTA